MRLKGGSVPTRYFTVDLDGERHSLTRRRGEEGEIIEYADPKTGLWIEDPTIFELFIGEEWSGPDPDLTEISEDEARGLAVRDGMPLPEPAPEMIEPEDPEQVKLLVSHLRALREETRERARAYRRALTESEKDEARLGYQAHRRAQEHLRRLGAALPNPSDEPPRVINVVGVEIPGDALWTEDDDKLAKRIAQGWLANGLIERIIKETLDDAHLALFFHRGGKIPEGEVWS